MGNVTILVGAQWGDEGKGKWIDILAKNAFLVARYQGGNNAGHTLYIDNKKVVLHQIPSGIFHKDQKCALTAGVVINPDELEKEIDKVRGLVELEPDKLWISEKAHIITPWHIYLDSQKEASSDAPIGTTKRGIGPTYAAKAARTGLRVGDYINTKKRDAWITSMKKDEGFSHHYKNNKDDWEAFASASGKIRSFVCDAEKKIRASLQKGRQLLLEGAQGGLLDIDHGTYPFVTSSSTCSGGAFASLGFSPKYINKVIGVGKAYITRVGEGPFPTELDDEVGKFLAEKGHEFGATTGRPRRCGWFDAVAMKYCQAVNGFDEIILNKIDVLCGLEELKICVAYQHPELGRIDDMPSSHETLSQCSPIYESYQGWQGPIENVSNISLLPEAVRNYIAGVERHSNCEVTFIGTGVSRTDFIGR